MPGAELNQDYLDPFPLQDTLFNFEYCLLFNLTAETGGEDIQKEGRREGKEDRCLYELGPVRLN